MSEKEAAAGAIGGFMSDEDLEDYLESISQVVDGIDPETASESDLRDALQRIQDLTADATGDDDDDDEEEIDVEPEEDGEEEEEEEVEK